MQIYPNSLFLVIKGACMCVCVYVCVRARWYKCICVINFYTSDISLITQYIPPHFFSLSDILSFPAKRPSEIEMESFGPHLPVN